MTGSTIGLLSGSSFEQEIELEISAVRKGVQRYRALAEKAVNRGDGASLKPAERLIGHWFHIMLWAVREEQKSCQRGETGYYRKNYGVQLNSLDADLVSAIAMREALNMCIKAGSAGIRLLAVSEAIGRAMNAEVNIKGVQDNEDAFSELRKTDRRRIYPQHIIRISKKHIDGHVEWARRQKIAVGMCLVRLLCDVASCDDYEELFVPAFENKLIQWRGKNRTNSFRLLSLTSEALQVIEDGHSIRQHLRPRYLPMIVPPLPWTDHSTGGYLRLRTELVKRACPQHREMLRDVDPRVLKAVNYISSIKYKIDPYIYKISSEAYADGMERPGIPQIRDIEMPEKPEGFFDDEETEAKKDWKRAAVLVHRANIARRSERIAYIGRMNVADEFVKEDHIYLPHHLDSRGRVYPIPIYLNHHGEDASRAMFHFGEAKALGKRGLFWLKVQAANSYGNDSGSFEDRVEWVDAATEGLLRQSSEDPLNTNEWHDADDPWQFLSASREIIAAIDNPSGVENYRCSLPIQQDGKCNALQHYAALGRDEIAAKATSVTPSDQPSDVYSIVLERVQEVMAKDNEKGHPMAGLLIGRVERKTVKRPIMTKTYGVTAIGARRQVEEILMGTDIDKKKIWEASKYLSELTLNCMDDVCAKASEIMEWLQSITKIVVAQKEMMYWMSPLGFPVYQDYYKPNKLKVRMCLQEVWIQNRPERAAPKPRPIKNKNACAPNFIHSIDACHLMMVALRCEQEKIAFSTVHDSFWTHACDVDLLRDLTRQEFLALHEQPILENFVEQFREKYPNIKFPDPPKPEGLALIKCLESRYLFS